MATDTSTRTIRLDPPPPAPARMPPPAPGTGVSQRPAPVAPPPAAQPTPVRPAARPTAAPSSSAPQTPESVGASRRLLAGVLWGPVAIGAAMLLQMWASAQGGDQAVRPLRLLTVLVEGGGALAGGNSLLGIAVNTALGMVLGVLFALVAPRLRGPRAVLVGALVFAAGVFAVDLYALSPALSPVLELRDAPLLLASRLVFGAVLAIPFLAARRP
ncbi:MAG: hypothetical protein ABGZ36_04335 [Actinomycetota bacterium]